MKMSGNAFNEKLENLMSLGIVGVRKAKSRRNRLFYLYLTDAGERLFEKKYGKVREEARADTSIVEKKMSNDGWNVKRADNVIVCKKGNQECRIRVQEILDKRIIKEALKEHSYFIAASGEIKNIVIQEAAKLPDIREIFVATADEANDKGYLGRIEFS
jgi:hypothetical protein